MSCPLSQLHEGNMQKGSLWSVKKKRSYYQRKCADCMSGTRHKLYRSSYWASRFQSGENILTMELVTCGLQMKNYFSYSINWHSTNLSSVAIVCKSFLYSSACTSLTVLSSLY